MDDTIDITGTPGENTPVLDSTSVDENINEILNLALDTLGLELDNGVSTASPIEETTDRIVDEAIEEEHIEEQGDDPEGDIIRPNSPTLLVDETSSRFSDAIWADAIRTKTVTLAGVGGIGSYVGFLLSRLKPSRIILYDPDIVEATNMSGQLYEGANIGKPKVAALSQTMQRFSGYYTTYSYPTRFIGSTPISNIMICGFDNMAARRTFYESWKRGVNSVFKDIKSDSLLIDGRLAAEEFQVFCIKGDDDYHMKQYESKWLFSDEEAEETICSYKQTSHCANMIASVMVNLFVNFVANQCNPLIDRDVPFMTSYDASTMYFKTIS